MQMRPLTSGSSASTDRARNRRVPSEIALAANSCPPASTTVSVSNSRVLSRTTSTRATGTSSARREDILAATSPFGPSNSFSRLRAAARWAPLSETTTGSLAMRSGRRMALGSRESNRQLCISLRAARIVGVAIVLVVPTIVLGAARAGALCPGPREPPS